MEVSLALFDDRKMTKAFGVDTAVRQEEFLQERR